MSEFWVRKMKRLYTVLDVFKTCVLNKNDYLMFGERLCDASNASADDREEVRRQLDICWKIYTHAAGSRDDVLLTEDVLIESLKMQKDDPAVLAALQKIVLSMLIAFDANKDGFLQPDEHRKYFESVGVKDVDKFSKIAFEAIDTNKDGKLSKEEMSAAFSDFIASEDENNPNQYFFGYFP